MLDSERKYVDLLFRVSKKYAAWDPELSVEVGDWGAITAGRAGLAFWNRHRGTFLKEGNIYTDGTAKKHGIPGAKEYGSEASEGVTWIVSENSEEVNVDAAAGGQTTPFSSCKVKAGFKFDAGSGAVLAMDRDTVSSIDPPGSLRRLLEDETMKGRVIVSEIHRTSSFARFFSAKSGNTITIGLTAEPPVGNAVACDVVAKWVCGSKAGNFKSKVSNSREYTPLFRLVSLREESVSIGFRGSEGTELPLPDAEPPWSEKDLKLDSKGSKLKFWSK